MRTWDREINFLFKFEHLDNETSYKKILSILFNLYF